MEIKDRLVSWFVKNVAMPQMEVIDKPGFIILHFSEKKEYVYLREILMPESIFVNVEKEVVKKFGDKGARAMYAAGKEFGYRYSATSLFPQLNAGNEKQIEDFTYMFMRYIESIWSERVTCNIEWAEKVFDIDAENFAVCNKDGLGYIIPDGTGAGFWSYMVKDDTVEGVELKCQGKGDPKCRLFYAPAEVLEKRDIKYNEFVIQDKSVLSSVGPSYVEMNKVRDTMFSFNSLKTLIDSKLMNYSNGSMFFNNERHILCESSLMYFFENRIGALPGGSKMIFDASFNFGKTVMSYNKGKSVEKYISDYLSPCGWGDIRVTQKDGKYQVVSNYFPWTQLADKIKFSMFSGIVSGMMSQGFGKDIVMKNASTSVLDGLSVTLSE